MILCGKLIHSAQAVTIKIQDEIIISRDAGLSPDAALGGADVWIAPAFVDLQINGPGGINGKITLVESSRQCHCGQGGQCDPVPMARG